LDVQVDSDEALFLYDNYEFTTEPVTISEKSGGTEFILLAVDSVTVARQDIVPQRLVPTNRDIYTFKIYDRKSNGNEGFIIPGLSGSSTITVNGEQVYREFELGRITPTAGGYAYVGNNIWTADLPRTMAIESTGPFSSLFTDSSLLFSGEVGGRQIYVLLEWIKLQRVRSIMVYGPSPRLGLLTAASGNWNDIATWDGVIPAASEDYTATVTQHTVTVGDDSSAQSLLIDDAGTLVIADNSNLTVVNALEINNGTLEIAPTGTVNVGGNLTMTPQAEYVYQFGTTANGLTIVSGDADLDGTLIVQATGGLEALGLSTRPILVAGRIVDSFANEPAVGGHLGYGVFHQGVWYNFGAGVVREEVFQAAAGDVDGDGQVNNADLQGILSANSFNQGTGFDWTGGDFNGDDLVGNDDLQMVLATGYFGTGTYATAPSWGSEGELVIVPEPTVLILLLSGFLTLAGFFSIGGHNA
jgi:hypothetical protein